MHVFRPAAHGPHVDVHVVRLCHVGPSPSCLPSSLHGVSLLTLVSARWSSMISNTAGMSDLLFGPVDGTIHHRFPGKTGLLLFQEVMSAYKAFKSYYNLF